MHAKPDLRVVLEWKIAGSGSVITDVILLEQMNFSLRELLLLILLVSLYFPVQTAYKSWQRRHLEQSYPGYVSYDRISHAKNGDELSIVRGYFPQLEPVDNADAAVAIGDPTIRPDDEFFIFPAGHKVFRFIQFREGNLINYKTTNSVFAYETSKALNLPVPPWFVTIGHWPIYLGLVLISLVPSLKRRLFGRAGRETIAG